MGNVSAHRCHAVHLTTISKGKVEKSVAYLRSNFWPLRSFTDLADVNRQVRQWLEEMANVRLHRETRQRPSDRFRPDTLRPLPALAPDYRDTAEVLVYKDLHGILTPTVTTLHLATSNST